MPALADAITLRTRLGDPRTLADHLRRPGALRHGHFRLLSGLHTDQFLAFSAIAEDTEVVHELAGLLSPVVAPWCAEAVLAPSTAGVALGGALADRLGVALHLAALDEAGRAAGILGGDLCARRVLLVNDVVTTGQGVVALAAVARQGGAEVAGAAWFASRAEVELERMIAAPTAWIASLDLQTVPAERCAACERGRPFEDALDLN